MPWVHRRTANGELEHLGGGSYDSLKGIFTDSGSAAALTKDLQGLVFQPIAHEVAPGQNVTTGLSLGVTNDLGGVAQDATTTVVATAAEDAPVITGTQAGQATTDAAAIHPFSAVQVTDVDVGKLDTVTIVVSQPQNGELEHLGHGSYDSLKGIFTDSGSATTLTKDVQGLVFQPIAHEAAPGQSVTTRFSIIAQDNFGGAAIDAKTTILELASTRDDQNANPTHGHEIESAPAIAPTGNTTMLTYSMPSTTDYQSPPPQTDTQLHIQKLFLNMVPGHIGSTESHETESFSHPHDQAIQHSAENGSFHDHHDTTSPLHDMFGHDAISHDQSFPIAHGHLTLNATLSAVSRRGRNEKWIVSFGERCGNPGLVEQARPLLRRTLHVSLLFGLVLNLVQLGIPIYTMQVFDRVIPTGHLATLAALTLLLGAVTFCSLFVDSSRGLLLAGCSHRFGKIFDEPVAQYTLMERKGGVTLSRCR